MNDSQLMLAEIISLVFQAFALVGGVAVVWKAAAFLSGLRSDLDHHADDVRKLLANHEERLDGHDAYHTQQEEQGVKWSQVRAERFATAMGSVASHTSMPKDDVNRMLDLLRKQ